MASDDDKSEATESGSLAVSARGFSKHYGKQTAVNRVDLDIRKGEIYGLIGPDGSGKSSFMKAVAGVLSFEEGTLQVFDTVVDSEASAELIKQRIGFMPQGLGLNMYPDLSVEENIDFFARLRLVPDQSLTERKSRLLAMTRLEAFRDRPMKNLSGGMKQKLGLVCTLIHEPELIILDEPTTGVDPVSRRDFWSILARLLREQGITALVSTAYMDEATRFQRAALMYQGKVLAEGEPDVIGNLAQGTMITIDVEDQTKALALLSEQFEQIEAVGSRLRVWVDEPDEAAAEIQLRNALGGFVVHHVECDTPGLEDVFVAKLRQEGHVVAELPAFEAGTSSASGVAIEAHELSKCFDDFTAVDKISFTVPQGEIFGLLGANGAGKTTAIKMLTGIQLPTSGEGQVAGANMSTAAQLIKQRIGYMSQAFSLYLDLSVSENIKLFAGVYGLDPSMRRERSPWIIELAGLQGYEKDLAGSLPMGLRQRLALGCALVHKPQILFLDEPTSGVDPLGRRRFWEILFNLARVQNVTILVTTHYMSEAEHCDHLALMYAGKVVADDTPDNMKSAVTAEAGGLLEVSVDNPINAVGVLEESDYKGAALFGRKIHLWAPDDESSRNRIQSLLAEAGIAVLGIRSRSLSMEDVFVYRVLQQEKAREQSAA